VKFNLIILLFCAYSAAAQLPLNEQQFLSRLQPGDTLPEKILATRSVVFYPVSMTTKELETIQKSFQRTGIDATLYFESDFLSSGRDGSVAFAEYLNKREINNLIIFRKENGYQVYIAKYNRKANLVEQNQNAWIRSDQYLDQLLMEIYRTAANAYKNENFLINDVPETGFAINAIDGNRNDYFAIDLKVDQLAVPKFGDEAMDKELEEIMSTYPHKYKLTEANLSESELRKQGFLYVLRFVHAKNRVAKTILGYEIKRAESAIVSVAFNVDGEQLKNIPANEVIYKFYFKHIETKNVFLGRKWDADQSWQQALWNQLRGYKKEFKID
jgi:hypothetical protein